MIKGETGATGIFSLLYGEQASVDQASMNIEDGLFLAKWDRQKSGSSPTKTLNSSLPADKPGEFLIAMKGRIEIPYNQKGYPKVQTPNVDAPYPSKSGLRWIRELVAVRG